MSATDVFEEVRQPEHGTHGVHINLIANYMEMKTMADADCNKSGARRIQSVLYTYRFNMLPVNGNQKRVIGLWLDLMASAEGSDIAMATDFANTLVTNQPISAHYPRHIALEKLDYTVTLDLPGMTPLALSDLNQYLRSGQVSDMRLARLDHWTAVLNIIVRHYALSRPQTHFFLNGAAFDTQEATKITDCRLLGGGIEEQRGFVSSVRLNSGLILVNIHTHHVVFYRAMLLSELIEEFLSYQRGKIDGFGSTTMLNSLRSFLLGIRVQTTNTSRPCAFNISNVYLDGDGTGIQVHHGYRTTHLRVLPCQLFKGRLDKSQRNMKKRGMRRLDTNKKNMPEKAAQVLGLAAGSGPERFGLRVNTQFVSVSARSLPTSDHLWKPILKQQQVEQFERPEAVGSSWECIVLADDAKTWPRDFDAVARGVDMLCAVLNDRGMKAEKPRPIRGVPLAQLEARLVQAKRLDRRLVLVVLETHSSEAYAQIKTLGNARVGVATACVLRSTLKAVADKSDARLLGMALQINLKLGGCNQRLADSNPRRQGCGGGNGRNGNGNRNSGRGRPLAALDLSSTMIVGIDVTHPSAQSTRTAPSIAAVVASMDENLAQWPAELRVQKGNTEIVADLCGMMEAQLLRWKEKKSRLGMPLLPRSVLVYRDGVSESQFDQVTSIEVSRLREAFDRVYGEVYGKGQAKLPKLTIVLVIKRHHVRFTVKDEPGGFNGSFDSDWITATNTPLGTVVDKEITSKTRWEFFLHSGRAESGTAQAIRHVVLVDEIFRRRCGKPAQVLGVDLTAGRNGKNPLEPTCTLSPADALQSVTLALCHIYSRTTDPVRIATPVYYADLACGHARLHLRHEFCYRGVNQPMAGSPEDTAVAQQRIISVQEDLKNTMFYL